MWLVSKHLFRLGMQLKDPVYTDKFIVAALAFSLSQFDPSAAAVLAVSLLHTGLAERSHRMTETTKRRQKARQSGSKKKGSEVRGQQTAL